MPIHRPLQLIVQRNNDGIPHRTHIDEEDGRDAGLGIEPLFYFISFHFIFLLVYKVWQMVRMEGKGVV